MLVQPIRHERPRDPFVPPRQRTHLLDPLLRDVPVVAHLVVVEDHRRRHRREKPPDVGVGPRLAIQLRVLLEIGDLLTRRISDVSTRTDERGCFRRDVVDVHLVTHQQESIRPFDRSHLQLARIRPQRIDAEAVRMVRRSERVRRPLRRTDPAGSEDQPSLAFSLSRANRRTRPAVDRRPDFPTVQAHLVGIDRSGFEVLDQHERIVMPKHLKGVCVVSKHVHDCGRIGLDPDSGRRRSDVAKERAEDEPDVPAWIVERDPVEPVQCVFGAHGRILSFADPGYARCQAHDQPMIACESDRGAGGYERNPKDRRR